MTGLLLDSRVSSSHAESDGFGTQLEESFLIVRDGDWIDSGYIRM